MTSKVILVKHDVGSICDFLSRRLSISLVPDNVNNPTVEIVQTIYYNFMKKALDVPDNSMSTLPLSVDVDIDHELHRRSIPLVQMYHILKKFVQDATDGKILLTMCDFVNPAKNAPKLRKILSFFVDFLKFLEVMNPEIDKIVEGINDQKEKLTLIQQEARTIEKKKQELLKHKNARNRREAELTYEVQKVNEELNAIVKEYEGVIGRREGIEKKIEETNLEKHRLEAETKVLKNIFDQMTGQLMSSPDRVKSEIDIKKKQIVQFEAMIMETEKLLEKRKRALAIYSDAQKTISWINEKSTTLINEKQSLQCLTDELTDNELRIEELEQEYAFACDKYSSLDEKLKELTENHLKLKKEHMERISSLQNDFKNVERSITSRKSEPNASLDANGKNSELIIVRNAISELNRTSVQEAAELTSEFEKLVEKMETHRGKESDHLRAVERVFSRIINSMDGKINANITVSETNLVDITYT